MIRRRNFITLLSGAAAWPFAARAQQGDRIRRIGVLMNVTADHPDATPRFAAFRETLRELGWVEGRNVSIEVRWGGRFRTLSAIRSGIGCASA
jgi:putative ABC transport system substrate-binding protein